jgi:hypothetical protein
MLTSAILSHRNSRFSRVYYNDDLFEEFARLVQTHERDEFDEDFEAYRTA